MNGVIGNVCWKAWAPVGIYDESQLHRFQQSSSQRIQRVHEFCFNIQKCYGIHLNVDVDVSTIERGQWTERTQHHTKIVATMAEVPSNFKKKRNTHSHICAVVDSLYPSKPYLAIHTVFPMGHISIGGDTHGTRDTENRRLGVKFPQRASFSSLPFRLSVVYTLPSVSCRIRKFSM